MPSAKVGDTLTRSDGARIRLVGVMGAEFIAQPLDEFGTPFRVTAAELVGLYGITDPSVPPEDSYPAVMAKADAAATAEANRAFGESHPETRRARRREQELAKLGQAGGWRPPAGSPEAAFAAAEVTDDD